MDLHHILTSQPYQSFYNIHLPMVNPPWVLPKVSMKVSLHSGHILKLWLHWCVGVIIPVWVFSIRGDLLLQRVMLVTSSQVGACSWEPVMIFLCGASAVASAHVGPSSPRGGAGQCDQSPCSALSHSSPESEGSTQLSVSDSSSSPAGILWTNLGECAVLSVLTHYVDKGWCYWGC